MTDDAFLDDTLPHLEMVHNLSRRLTASREEAEDLVQETYLKALRAWRRGRPDHIAPWLATICLNIARSLHRRRKARPTEVLSADVDERTDDDREATDRRVVVHQALGRLSSEQREAIVLMDLCGFTAAQVGTMLGVPRNTVLSRAHRGHKRLAVLLEAEVGDEP